MMKQIGLHEAEGFKLSVLIELYLLEPAVKYHRNVHLLLTAYSFEQTDRKRPHLTTAL